MTVRIDASDVTRFLTAPLEEGWVESDVAVDVTSNLTAQAVTEDDVALLPLPEATLLTSTHVIDRSVAVVQQEQGMVAMWTVERPDEIDQPTVWLQHIGSSSEVLIRALLKPFFGIEASEVVHVDTAPEEANLIVTEGGASLADVERGYREDLARSWFILTGKPFVSHVAVVGVRALARDADTQLDVLRRAAEAGWERRRDIRRMIREHAGIESEPLASVTNALRFSMEEADQEPARMLVERGTWGTRFGRTLPALRDQLGQRESPEGTES